MIATEIQENAAQYLMNTYARLPLTVERGQGCLVYDAEGREYLDCLAGIAVNIMGHAHPDIVEAITRQAPAAYPYVQSVFYGTTNAVG